jgi:hypothetical protein
MTQWLSRRVGQENVATSVQLMTRSAWLMPAPEILRAPLMSAIRNTGPLLYPHSDSTEWIFANRASDVDPHTLKAVLEIERTPPPRHRPWAEKPDRR